MMVSCERGKKFSNSIQRGEPDEMEIVDRADGWQPRELPSLLSTGQGHFLRWPHASIYTRADLRGGSDVTILTGCESTSALFSLIHNS